MAVVWRTTPMPQIYPNFQLLWFGMGLRHPFKFDILGEQK